MTLTVDYNGIKNVFTYMNDISETILNSSPDHKKLTECSKSLYNRNEVITAKCVVLSPLMWSYHTRPLHVPATVLVGPCHIVEDLIKFILCSFGAYNAYDMHAGRYQCSYVTMRKFSIQ